MIIKQSNKITHGNELIRGPDPVRDLRNVNINETGLDYYEVFNLEQTDVIWYYNPNSII